MITQEEIDKAAEVYTSKTLSDPTCDTDFDSLKEYCKEDFKAGVEWTLKDIKYELETLILNNEDDFDRGKGKIILQQFIKNFKL